MLLLCIECLLRNALLLFMPGMFPWLGVGFLLSIETLAYFISLGEHYFCLFFYMWFHFVYFRVVDYTR